jgi:hypothetical protein
MTKRSFRFRQTTAGSLFLRFAMAAVLLVAFSGMTAAFDVDETLKTDREMVRELQRHLTDLGYRPGSIDGIAGSSVQRAIESFRDEQAQDLAAGLTHEIVERIRLAHHSWFGAPEYEPQRIFSQPQPVYDVNLAALDPSCDVPDCVIQMLFLADDDLTGDGLADLVFSTIQFERNGKDSGRPSPLVVLANTGRGGLMPLHNPEMLPLRVHGREAAVADFTGDGLNDIFVAAHGLDRPPFPGEQSLLLVSSADGLIDASSTNLPPLIAMNHGVVSHDINGDGHMDLFVITNHGREPMDPYFLINDGAGNFERSDEAARLTPSLRRFVSERHDRSKSLTVRFFDVNHDGFDDMIFAISGDNGDKATNYPGLRRTRIILNDGENRWLRENAYELPVRRWGHWTHTTDIDGADVNGDGYVDLLLSLSTSSGDMWRGHHLQLLINDGQGRFTDATATHMWPQGYANQSEPAFPLNSFLVDLNNDGHVDIVTQSLDPIWGDRSELRPVVAMNDGTGRFVPLDPLSFAHLSHYGRQIRPVDLDGDGDLDLVGVRLIGREIDGEFYTSGFTIQVFRNTTTTAVGE